VSFKRNLYFVTAGIFSVFFCLAACAMKEGQPSPGLTAKTLQGAPFDLHKESGKVVIIHFWATWCSPCRLEMPILESYYQQHKNEGLQVLAISMDDPADDHAVQNVMQTFSYPAAYQREADYKGYGRIWRMPMTFIIDRQGILRRDGSEGDPKIDLPLLEKSVTPLLKADQNPH